MRKLHFFPLEPVFSPHFPGKIAENGSSACFFGKKYLHFGKDCDTINVCIAIKGRFGPRGEWEELCIKWATRSYMEGTACA